MTDWHIVIQGILGIEWLKECNDEKNHNKTIKELIKEKFLDDFGEYKLLNTGVLLMAAYLLFVYPKETDFAEVNLDSINLNNFKIVQEDNDNDTKSKLLRRLRNSIAHGNYKIHVDIITFEDNNRKESDYIKFQTGIVEFGNFLDSFVREVNNQKANLL